MPKSRPKDQQRPLFFWSGIVFAALVPLFIWFGFPFHAWQENIGQYRVAMGGAILFHCLAFFAFGWERTNPPEDGRNLVDLLLGFAAMAFLTFLFYFFIDFVLMLIIFLSAALVSSIPLFAVYFLVVLVMRVVGLGKDFDRSEFLKQFKAFLLALVAVPICIGCFVFFVRKDCFVHWYSFGYDNYDLCVEQHNPMPTSNPNDF